MRASEKGVSRSNAAAGATTIALASGSATRAALLRAAGVSFAVHPAWIDERSVAAPLIAEGHTPAAVAEALADAKAVAVSREMPASLVIGADQTLDFDGALWTKPATIAAARKQIVRLQGRAHRLETAVAVAIGGTVRWRHLESATLTMRELTTAEIDAYLKRAGDRVLASVGGYQIEGQAIQLFTAIRGDYFAILGLPLLPLLNFLRNEGALTMAGT